MSSAKVSTALQVRNKNLKNKTVQVDHCIKLSYTHCSINWSPANTEWSLKDGRIKNVIWFIFFTEAGWFIATNLLVSNASSRYKFFFYIAGMIYASSSICVLCTEDYLPENITSKATNKRKTGREINIFPVYVLFRFANELGVKMFL